MMKRHLIWERHKRSVEVKHNKRTAIKLWGKAAANLDADRIADMLLLRRLKEMGGIDGGWMSDE